MFTTILSILGVIGFFIDNSIMLYIGMFAVIIEDIIGFATKKLKSLSSLFVTILIGILLSFLGIDILKSIALCICIEQIIMIIGGIILLKNNKIINSNSDNKYSYFYVNDCVEMNQLINKWSKLPGFTSRKRRILILDDFDNLQTTTAKTIFLFNLILDMSDEYNVFRSYMNTLQIIDKEYVKESNRFLKYNNQCLEKANYILSVLNNEPSFKIYLNTVFILLFDFKMLYTTLTTIQNKIESHLNKGNEKLEDFVLINADCIQLMNFTEDCAFHFQQLQEIINNNEEIKK